MNTLVVAANNKEDTMWTERVIGWDVQIFSDYHPPGRECDAYLEWICNNYAYEDWSEVALCHGHPFDHDPHFLAHLDDPTFRYYGPIEECDPEGMPRIEWAMLDSWCRVLGLAPQPYYRFVAGAQYRLTKEQVVHHSQDFYKAIYYLTKIPANQSLFIGTNMPSNPSAYALERLWSIIWDVKL